MGEPRENAGDWRQLRLAALPLQIPRQFTFWRRQNCKGRLCVCKGADELNPLRCENPKCRQVMEGPGFGTGAIVRFQGTFLVQMVP